MEPIDTIENKILEISQYSEEKMNMEFYKQTIDQDLGFVPPNPKTVLKEWISKNTQAVKITICTNDMTQKYLSNPKTVNKISLFKALIASVALINGLSDVAAIIVIEELFRNGLNNICGN